MSKVTFETPKYKVKVKMESDECFLRYYSIL